MAVGRDNDEGDVESRFEKLKAGASNLKLNLKIQFWLFVSNQAKYLIKNDSSLFYDVISSSTVNPLSSPEAIEAGGGVAVAIRSIRVLLIPFQKLLQYGAWYNATQEYEARYAQELKNLQELKKPRAPNQDKILHAEDPAEEAKKWALEEDERVARVNKKMAVLEQEHLEHLRNPNEIGGAKKPEFTGRDGLYMLLDIVLLALAIAALVYGVSIAGAAIATTAAVISAGAAALNYGKHLYNGRKMKQEKQAVDELLIDFDKPQAELRELNQNEKNFVAEQKEKLAKEYPKGIYDAATKEVRKVDELTDQQILQYRSDALDKNIRLSVKDNYQAVRKSLGVALTMLSVVSASLILGGLLLGPFGAPVIAAGVALAMVATAIVVGMMVANWVKNYRDKKRERESPLARLDADAIEVKNDMNVVPTNRVVNDRLYQETSQLQEKPVEQNDLRGNKGKLVSPFVHPVEEPRRSLFDRSEKREVRNDVGMEDFSPPKDPPQPK